MSFFSFLGNAAKTVGHDVVAIDKKVVQPFSFLKSNPRQGTPFAPASQQIQTAKNIVQGAGRQTVSLGAPIGSEIYNQAVAPTFHLPQQTFNTSSLGLGNEEIQSPSQVFTSTNQTHGKPFSFLAAGITAAGALPFGGGEGDVLKQLAKTSTKEDALKTLVKSGVDEAKAKGIAPAIAQTKDPHIIDNILRGETKIQPPPPPINPVKPPQPIGDLPKKPNVLQKAALSVTGELSKQGEAGQEIAARLKTARDTSETGQAQFVQKIPTVLSLKPNEFEQFHDALAAADKGEAVNADSRVIQAVKEWQQNIPSVREQANKVGLDVGDLGQNYFPRSYTELLSSDAGRNIAAKHLVSTGQADNLGEAAMMLDRMKAKYNTPFGHFENSRTLDLPGYDTSKNAILGYVSGAFDKIAHAEQFGPRNEYAKELIGQIGKEGHDIGRALDNFQIASGIKQYDTPVKEAVSSSLRGFNRLRSLGLSSILNATQTNNTAAVTGIWRTAGSAFKSFTPSEKKYIKDSGVIIDSVLSNLREQAGVAGKITGKLTAPGFNTVEKFNRSVAAVAGKGYANKLAAKAFKGNTKAETTLREKLGIKGDIGPKLTPDQEIQAGRKMVELTQFKVDPQDLPNWVNSPEGKLVAQFRTFTYKQTGFVYNQVLKEAAKGNFLPLTRFLAVGIPLGIGAGVIRGELRGQPWQGIKGNQDNPGQDHVSQVIEGLGNVGAFGIGGDAKFLFQNRASQRLPQYLAGTVGGPTAGLAVQTATNAASAFGGSPTALERQGLSSIPIAGPKISNTVIPYTGLNKSENETIAKLKSEGASPDQIKTYNAFFTVKTPKSPNKQIDEALKNNDYNKAYKLAQDYNSKIEKAYSGWVKNYAQKYGTNDLYDRYTRKFINPDGFDARLQNLTTPILSK